MGSARRILGLVAAPIALLAFGAAWAFGGCASTPSPVPIRTFEQPQKMIDVCLQVIEPDGGAVAQPIPLPIGACPPVPPNVVGTGFQNHFFVLVTQQTRGELGVVDLTGGTVVDEDNTTPGTNLIPVGANPSDVVTSPDVLLQESNTTYPPLVFVSSQNVDQPSIYAIPQSRLLGTSVGINAQAPKLTSLFACSLPGPPMALGTVMLNGNDGGAGPPYAIVALLQPLVAGRAPQLVTVDPTPFSGVPVPGGPTPYQPGGLTPCTVMGSTTFVGSVPASASPPVSWPDGVPYAEAGDITDTLPPLGPNCGPSALDGALPDGDLADAGTASDASEDGAMLPTSPMTDGATPSTSPVADGAAPFSLSGGPSPTAMVVRDDAPIVYVADNGVPLIHVIDLSNPSDPVEVGQMLATSAANPSRQVPVGSLALSPPTSDLHRYLYAIDQYDGSLMVFDATSATPQNPPQTPMYRPYPELSPFAPVDRLVFAAPVATMTFVLHDWPLVPPSPNTDQVHSFSGLLCNPNVNAAEPDASGVFFADGGLGGYYRQDQASVIQPQGTGVQGFPHRLRGIFAFVTLSNGSMVTVDVDDWDAPCRRPDPMEFDAGPDGGPLADFQVGVLALPQVAPSGPSDLNPFHAPRTVLPNGQTGVTQEAFFPVSAPNRVRSGFLLRNDPVSGENLPFVLTPPTLNNLTGSVTAFSTTGSVSLIVPTALSPGFVDPSYIENPTDPGLNYQYISVPLGTGNGQNAVLVPGPQTAAGVRVSFDDPTASINQDWTVTYEGVLPTANNIFADIASTDGYQTLLFTPAPATLEYGQGNGAQFCERGIEDWNVGQSRAAAALDAMRAAGLTPSAAAETLGAWTADYVEITDDLLASTDGYWSESTTVNSCWQGLELTDGTALDDDSLPNIATLRYNACFATYNSSVNADFYIARDFPILTATDNALEVGRFGWQPAFQEQTTNRIVVGPDPSNAPVLRQAACCFHNQAGFKVRTGGEWVTVGQIGSNPGIGLLHHVVPEPGTGKCVIQCNDPSKVLLNARAFDVTPPESACSPSSTAPPPPAIERNSPLAMRNPMFSFVMWGPCGTPAAMTLPDGGVATPAHTLTTRDLQWRFSLRGGFIPLSVSVQGTSPVPVSPQSMLYLGPYSQLAIIDGATNGQGLVLIDVNTLGFAHAPYF